MKKISILVLAISLTLMLVGCSCEHQWKDADCTTPRTCTLCGETEGAPLGHVWAAATCTSPKTCTVCGLTEGEATGHTWTEATCTTPKTCTVCHTTEGEASGHDWQDATTETPKTCSHCGLTEGERIITDDRFTTSACKDLFGAWSCTADLPASYFGTDFSKYSDEITIKFTHDFHNDGTLTVTGTLMDEAKFYNLYYRFLSDTIYSEFSQQGYGKDAADAAFLQAYNMTIDAYVTAVLDESDVCKLFNENAVVNGVYFVQNNTVWYADSWNGTFSFYEFTLDGGKLTMPIDLGVDIIGEFTRES